MLLSRTENTTLYADPYQQETAGQGVAYVQDPFSYAVGQSMTIAIPPMTTGQAVPLPFGEGGFLRIESLSPIQFALNGDTNYTALAPPSTSAAGNPLTAVVMMLVSFTELALSNPSTNTVYVNLLMAGN